MRTAEDHMNQLRSLSRYTYSHVTRDAVVFALAEMERLEAEIDRLKAELSKPRPHVVAPAVDPRGHVRCISCGRNFQIHADTCFRHEQLIREGKVSDFPREVFLGMLPQPTEGGQSC